jgi:hypothetical protein
VSVLRKSIHGLLEDAENGLSVNFDAFAKTNYAV